MNLWRPKSRTEWWLAFAASLSFVPFTLSMAGILLAQSLNAPLFYPAGILAAPVFAGYLISHTRMRLVVKVLFICAAFAGIAFSYLPRSSCGEEDSLNIKGGAVTEGKTGEGGCNVLSQKT